MMGLFLDRIMSTVSYDSFWEYLFLYLFIGIVIIVGLIILRRVREGEKPITPARFYDEYKETKWMLTELIKIAPTANYAQITKKRTEVQVKLNKMVDSATKTIDEERDVTFEPVRDALVRAVRFLDSEKNVGFNHDATVANFNSALAEMDAVKDNLEEIEMRYKKFGK